MFCKSCKLFSGNTKNRQILNNVIKYSSFGSWQGSYLKSINTGDIFKAAMTEEKFSKSERYKINGKHFRPKK